MGYYVGQAWKLPVQRMRLIMQGYLTAVVLHGLYDFPLITMGALGSGGPTGMLGAATCIVLCCTWWWAVRLTGGVRREQLRQASQLAFPAGTLHPAPSSQSRILPVVQIALGVIGASAGGMVALGLLLAFVLGIVSAEDRMDVLLGGAIIGVLPLAAGGLLFRSGVRRLNRNPIVAS
jgi:hypothetical protein